MQAKVIGIDLGKSVFHLHGVDERGQVVLQKRLTPEKVVTLLAQMLPCRVGMEACGGAHYWARRLQALGHEVKLISPQFVKPYVKSNKNDGLDAEAICEAVSRPNMRFVPIKSLEQQSVQALHRARELAVRSRTAVANQLRGLLLEQGIALRQGVATLRQQVPVILDEAESELPERLRSVLAERYAELRRQDERIAELDKQIQHLARQDERCQRLMTIPGIGPQAATLLLASIGKGEQFRNGRELAAWVGVVPRQHSTGGRSRLLGISKRGDAHLRRVLVIGARAVLRWAPGKSDAHRRWLLVLQARRGVYKAAVALANKMLRIAWVLLCRGGVYQSPAVAEA